MTQRDSNLRLLLYLGIAFLSVINPALEAESPNWASVIVSATMATMTAWRSYIDQSQSQVTEPPAEDAAG